MLPDLWRTLQDYYPEHLGLLFVINTPLIFRGIWAAVSSRADAASRTMAAWLCMLKLPSRHLLGKGSALLVR